MPLLDLMTLDLDEEDGADSRTVAGQRSGWSPMTPDREGAVSRAFVTIASSLANGDDVVDLVTELTTSCAQLLDIASAAACSPDTAGVLHVRAASTERTRQFEVFQLRRAEGPCRDCFQRGIPVSVDDLRQAAGQWPELAPAADVAERVVRRSLPAQALIDHEAGRRP